jgi:hypothetical protein
LTARSEHSPDGFLIATHFQREKFDGRSRMLTLQKVKQSNVVRANAATLAGFHRAGA